MHWSHLGPKVEPQRLSNPADRGMVHNNHSKFNNLGSSSSSSLRLLSRAKVGVHTLACTAGRNRGATALCQPRAAMTSRLSSQAGRHLSSPRWRGRSGCRGKLSRQWRETRLRCMLHRTSRSLGHQGSTPPSKCAPQFSGRHPQALSPVLWLENSSDRGFCPLWAT